jgi:hypothetical protein
MKRSTTHFLFALTLSFTLLMPLRMSCQSQCLRTSERCEGELGEFLSDGNYYGAQVNGVTEATLKLTLYEGFRYRIVTCNDRPNAKVKYRVLDSRKNEVFQTLGAKDGEAWEFELAATDNFTIKASIPNNVGLGCVIFEVGYDEEMLDDGVEFEEEDDPFFEDELDYDDPEDAGN